MSSEKRSLEQVALGVLTAVLTALVLGGWASKESTQSHGRSVDSLRFEQARTVDSIHFEMHQIKDAVCEGKPRRGPCK